MPANSAIAWVAAHETELVTAATTIGAVAVALWSKLSSLRVPKSWVAAEEATKGGVAPQLQPEPLTVATSHEADLQAMHARFMSTEAALLETQQAIKRIRAAMDQQAFAAAKEEGALSAALVSERAANEQLRAEVSELREKAGALLKEMQQLRSEGPDEPRGPRER